ncbi:MAG: hypothetical protein LUE64_00415 [Candidatus Gastranaerophilales bacterium]|nr:hypothetical protein [Candidatus Gastranaerophilales bacterium]
MKKKQLLVKILLLSSMALFLTACTTLDYVDTDYETVKSYNVQTNEMFNLRAIEKSSADVNVKAGISETPLEGALVLYMELKNNSDSTFKFDLRDVKASSPVGEISFLAPSAYVEAYQNFEAQNYASMANAGTMLGSFATIQNRYRQDVSNTTTNIENLNQSAEFAQLEKTIAGIQMHSVTSYKFIPSGEKQYFYIFLKKPQEYPIVINYKDLSYKFGGKKNAGD